MGIEMVGWGAVAPETVITNDALIELNGLGQFKSTDEWIRRRTGIVERRVADPTLGETAASLAAGAGRAALTMANLENADVDMIIVSTMTSDQRSPGVSPSVQDLLNLDGATTRECNNGCAGFVIGLNDAYRYIATGTERSLVVGVDLLSRITPQDKNNILFGDAAGAVVLQKTSREEAGLLGWYEETKSSPEYRKMLYCEQDGTITMDGQAVYKEIVPLAVHAAEMAMDRAGVKSDELRYIITHQANLRILMSIAERLDVDREEKMPWIGDRYGNTSSASVPLALAELATRGQLNRGDLVMLAGFGSGVNVAASVVRI
jgi:3-oxoacyl-[acyl-carrier-protein] synthase-3